MKYIIKNCPAIYINHNNEYDCDKADYLCQNCTDCVMKRIVRLCDDNMNKLLYDGEIMKLKFAEANSLAREIFDILEIEEVE